MSTEFDEFIACVSARLCDAEQCQTSVNSRVVANASRSLEAAVDAICLFICECEGIYQTDVPSHMRDSLRHNASQITNGELDEVVRSIAREHPSMGTVLVKGILSRSSMNVSRERTRKSLMRIDPINFVRCKHQTINRRKYFAPGPNARRHIDRNPWQLVVHPGERML